MKTKFFKRVLWLMIPLLTIFTTNVWGQASTHTSNVTLNNGTNCSNCSIVISGNSYSGKKLGTGSNTGSTSFSVPAGVTTVYIHAAKWNGESGNLTIARTGGGTVSPTSVTLTADGGVSSSSPFTLSAPAKATTDYFFTLTLSSVNSATTITLTTSSRRAVVWGVNTASTTKTFTLMLPKGDGTYDNTTTTTNASDLDDADIPFSKKNCGGETLNGTFYYYWVTSPISQGNAVGSMPSTKYNAANPPSSSTSLYPIFWDNDASGFDTDPRCVVACSSTPTMSFANSTVNKELTGAGSHTQSVTISGKGPGQTVAYSSSNTSIGTVNSSGVVSLTGTVGSTTITASVERDGTYCANSATYTINVARPKYTVTWSVNGNTSTISATTNVTHGTTVSMPTPSIPVDCTGSTFMGWTTSANASYSGDSAPSPLYNGTSPAITDDVTFYAVFADEAVIP